jgi:hypothetical protein
MMDSTHYGYDFYFYAEIKEDNVHTKVLEDYVLIELSKKVEGVWPRLLATVNKVSFFHILIFHLFPIRPISSI